MRRLAPTGFEDDHGGADPQLRQALSVTTARTADDEAHLVALVAGSRWLVPVVAAPGAESADLTSVTLTAPDGRRALPVFSGVDTLAVWDAAARPVPVTAERAAQAAVGEGCEVLVLDVGSPHATALRPSMVWALAERRTWLPASRDPVVAGAVSSAVVPEVAVLGHALEPGAPGSGALVVALRLRPGLRRDEVEALATRVGERLAADAQLRTRVDELMFRVARA